MPIAKKKARSRKIKAIPTGYHNVTPYLTIDGAAKAIDFYKKVFGAREIMRMEMPGGKIGHAEIKIGDSRIMLIDEFPNMGGHSPKSMGGSPVMIHLYIKKVDEVIKKALAAGATIKKPLQNQFYGDRSGSFIDPFGHEWYVATHVENVSLKEMRRRAEEYTQKQAA